MYVYQIFTCIYILWLSEFVVFATVAALESYQHLMAIDKRILITGTACDKH